MGKKEREKKNRIIILIAVVLFALIILLTSLGVLDIKMNLVYEKEYNISEITNISLNMEYYDLDVKRTNDDKIKIRYYGNDEENIKVQTTNNDLVVNMENHEFSHKNGFLEQKVVIFLPEGYIGIVNINGTDSDIKVTNKNNINLNITTTNGDITLNKIIKANVKTDDGDISVNNARVLIINSNDGDIKIKNIHEELNIKTVDADVSLNKLNLTNNSTIETLDGDINVNNIKNGKININQSKGEYINTKTYDGDYELKLITTSGDIMIH